MWILDDRIFSGRRSSRKLIDREIIDRLIGLFVGPAIAPSVPQLGSSSGLYDSLFRQGMYPDMLADGAADGHANSKSPIAPQVATSTKSRSAVHEWGAREESRSCPKGAMGSGQKATSSNNAVRRDRLELQRPSKQSPYLTRVSFCHPSSSHRTSSPRNGL